METKIIAKVPSYKNIKLEMNGENSKFVGKEDETEIIRYKTVDDYDEVYNNDEYYNPIKCKMAAVGLWQQPFIIAFYKIGMSAGTGHARPAAFRRADVSG